MTKLAAGYLNRAQIARHVKVRAIEARRKAWTGSHPTEDLEIARNTSKPRDPTRHGEHDTPLIPAA